MSISKLPFVLITFLFLFASAPVKAFEGIEHDPIDQRTGEDPSNADRPNGGVSGAEGASSSSALAGDNQDDAGASHFSGNTGDNLSHKRKYLDDHLGKLEYLEKKFSENDRGGGVFEKINDAKRLNREGYQVLRLVNLNQPDDNEQNTVSKEVVIDGFFYLCSTRVNLLEAIITCYYNRTYFLPQAYDG